MEAKIKLSISAAIIIAVIISSYFGDIRSTVTSSNNSSTSNNDSNNYASTKSKLLRIGYFPNLNHAQAVIGLQDGSFQKFLDNKKIKIESYVFSAGPSAIEALYSGQIDVAYLGPNPAINGYLASGGKDLRIISGVASAGAVFVVRNDSGIQSPKDLGGKKFASPQLGNTQDIALRKYLLDNGYKTVENGGNVTVVPVANPDILTLFLKKEIDGAWVPEPWGARLLKEANGRIFLDERDLWPDGKFVTANIIAKTEFLKNNPEILKQLLSAHVNETKWINDHKEDAINIFNTELKKITGKTIPADELREALTRLEITYDPLKISLFRSANNAYDVGLLAQGKPRPDLSGIFDLTLLNQVLTEKGLTPIEGGGKAAVNTNATEGGFGTVE